MFLIGNSPGEDTTPGWRNLCEFPQVSRTLACANPGLKGPEEMHCHHCLACPHPKTSDEQALHYKYRSEPTRQHTKKIWTLYYQLALK